MDIRQKIGDELKSFCDQYDVQSTWEMWNGKKSDRAIVVVGDCGKYLKWASGGAHGDEEKPASGRINFLNLYVGIYIHVRVCM